MLLLARSKVVRKSIARVLTVISQNQRAALRKAYTNKVGQFFKQGSVLAWSSRHGIRHQ